ncbi:hypothetical protein LINGRAPRIM_LOCUS932 [Linum grandiflorum]
MTMLVRVYRLLLVKATQLTKIVAPASII